MHFCTSLGKNLNAFAHNSSQKSVPSYYKHIFRIYVISDSLPIATASRTVTEIETFLKRGKKNYFKKRQYTLFTQILFARNKNPS